MATIVANIQGSLMTKRTGLGASDNLLSESLPVRAQ